MSNRHSTPALPALTLALCCLSLGTVQAVESSDKPGAPTAPVAEPAQPSPQQELLQALPQVEEVQLVGTNVVWKGNGASVTILSIDKQTNDPMIETANGPLRVERALISEHHFDAVSHVAELIAQAQAAKLANADLHLHEGILTGPNLAGDGIIVLPKGVLRKVDAPVPDRSAELTRVTSDIAKVIAALPGTGLDEIARRSLTDVLSKLDHPDGDEALDEIKPSFARRMVRRGWLRQWFSKPEAAALAKDLELAVIDATKAQPTSTMSGAGMRVEQVSDAFKVGGWVYRAPDKVRYARYEPKPEYIGHIADFMLAVDLPPESDPGSDAAKATAAQLFAGTKPIASWSADKGFTSDPGTWHQSVHVGWPDMVPNAIPPHIVLTDLHGDIAGLLVPKGMLKPVANTTKQAAERFLDDAAQLLPDANQLDLVGEYLFTYAYPSPDAKHPELLGNKQLKSNVQQTVWQTCGNVTGGSMHGDCADIAELYENVVSRQGFNPIVIGLPEHAACAWALKKNDDWAVTVLQTGPPMQFHDKVLPECLAKAYKSFDPGMNFDANQLPLLLRFSGEQSRSEWALSWRIFSDPAYAKTMFDVQRDWHYQTYQRGVATMTKMIADGDNDTANFRELSGLFSFTGQYLKAVEYQRKAIERTNEPISRLYQNLDTVGFLLAAEHTDEAKTLAEDILAKQLPPLRAQMGQAYPEFGLRFAATCTGIDEGQTGRGPALRELALKALQEIGGDEIDQAIDQIGGLLENPDFRKNQWSDNTQVLALRMRVAQYCGVGIELIKGLGHQALPGDQNTQNLTTAIQHWLNKIAFYDIEEDSAVMMQYSIAGRWYAAVQGQEEFDHQLDAASLPSTTIKVDHGTRQEGAAQEAKDLPWIKASVFYWYGRMAELFQRDQKTLDKAKVALFAKNLAQARITTAALGFTSPTSEYQAILGEEVAALVAKDEHALREVLHQVAISNDKELRDTAAQWLGDSARFMDMAWYARIMKIWVDEVDYKPKYFWIAWRAALNLAPKQALLAAKISADRFKDDPSFTEEYQYMRTLLENAKDADKTTAPASTPGVPAGHP